MSRPTEWWHPLPQGEEHTVQVPYTYTTQEPVYHIATEEIYTEPSTNNMIVGYALQASGAALGALDVPGAGLLSAAGTDITRPYAAPTDFRIYDGVKPVEQSGSVSYIYRDPVEFQENMEGHDIDSY